MEYKIRINAEKKEYTNSNIIEEVELDNEDNQLNPSMSSNHDGVYPMKSIKVEKGFFTSYELKRKFDKKPSMVVLDSSFQRENVWKIQQKRELIESILMGLPLPIFYFNEDKTGRLIVIDGRQRLGAIFEYMDNVFALDNLKILKDFNKKKFDNLDSVFRSKIEDYQMIAHVIQSTTPDRVKFDIFDRVNRAGTQLNKQEIRNALYQGQSTQLLNDLVLTKEFNEATEQYFTKDKRMKNKYLVLRFIAFYLYYNNKLYKDNAINGEIYVYSGDIDELLGLTMEYLNTVSENEIIAIKQCAIRAFEQISFYLGVNAFRLIDIAADGKIKRYPININIFETFSYAMTLLPYKDSKIREDVFNKLNSLKKDTAFRDSLNNHRDSDVKVTHRYETIISLIQEFV